MESGSEEPARRRPGAVDPDAAQLDLGLAGIFAEQSGRQPRRHRDAFNTALAPAGGAPVSRIS